jgi:N utilization substance protein B
MLNRRHLRIKSFQTAYAYHQVENQNLGHYEKVLMDSIESVHKTYIHLLNLLIELKHFELQDVADRSAKYLPTEEDKSAKAFLTNNSFINSLENNANFKSLLGKYNMSWAGEEVLLRELWNKLRSSDIFSAYQQRDEHSQQEDKELVTAIFKNIIFVDPLLEQYLEERYINWVVDKESVDGMLLKSVRSFAKNAAEIDILPITANWEDDRDFAITLFKECIRNDEEFDSLISDKTKNWELDRIALVDVILMKMAIAELIYFSSIPTKVTMNEYIDISKEFSTPKSKGFINGILDQILIDLKTSGRIVKIGRGLME